MEILLPGGIWRAEMHYVIKIGQTILEIRQFFDFQDGDRLGFSNFPMFGRLLWLAGPMYIIVPNFIKIS